MFDLAFLIYNPIVWVLVALPFIIYRDNKRRKLQARLNGGTPTPVSGASYNEIAAERVDELANNAENPSEADVLRRAAASIRLGLKQLMKKGEGEQTKVHQQIANDTAPVESPVQSIKPPVPAVSLAETGMKALQNINILLYLGAFFVVVAAGVFVGSSYGSLSDISKIILLGVFAASFYGIGLTLFAFTNKIKPAGVTFTAIGLLVAPLVGAGVQALVFQGKHAGMVWLITSAIMLILQVIAYMIIRKSYIVYYAALTTVSLFQSLTATVHAPVYWYGYAMLLTSLGYTLLARRMQDKSLMVALDQSAQFFVPLSVIFSLIGLIQFGLWSVGSQLVLVAAFYLVCAALRDFDQSKEELTYLTLSAGLFPIGLSMVFSARHVPVWGICIMLFAIATAYLFGEKFAPESKHRPIFHALAAVIAVCAPFLFLGTARSFGFAILASFVFHCVQWWVSRRSESYQLALATFLILPVAIGVWILPTALSAAVMGIVYAVCSLGVVAVSQYVVRPHSKEMARDHDIAGLLLIGIALLSAAIGSDSIMLTWVLGITGATTLFMSLTESPRLILGTVVAWHIAISVLAGHFEWSPIIQAALHGALASVFYGLHRTVSLFRTRPNIMLASYGAGLFLAFILGYQDQSLSGVLVMAAASAALYATTYGERDAKLPIVLATLASFGVIYHLTDVQNWYQPLTIMTWGTVIFGAGSLSQGFRSDIARWSGLGGVGFSLLLGLAPNTQIEEWISVMTNFLSGALALAESVHQKNRVGKYVASGLLWIAVLHTYSTLDIDFAQLYWQTTALYLAALAVRQRQRGDTEAEKGVTVAALIAATVPLGFQALGDLTGGYVLAIFALGITLLIFGMSRHNILIRSWAIGVLVIIALYKTAGYIFALPSWVWLGLIGLGALGGAMYLLSRRPHDDKSSN